MAEVRDIEDGATVLSFWGATVAVVADNRVPSGSYRFMGDSLECPIVPAEDLDLGPFASLDKAIQAALLADHHIYRVLMNPADMRALFDEATLIKR